MRRTDDQIADRGVSFVETVIAVVLLGVVIVPVMSSVMAVVSSSSDIRKTTRADSVLQDASDRINRTDLACNYVDLVVAAASTQQWPGSSVSVTYRRFIPGATPTVDGSWTTGSCVNGIVSDGLVQMVTITVRPPGEDYSRTLEVVKSNV